MLNVLPFCTSSWLAVSTSADSTPVDAIGGHERSFTPFTISQISLYEYFVSIDPTTGAVVGTSGGKISALCSAGTTFGFETARGRRS